MNGCSAESDDSIINRLVETKTIAQLYTIKAILETNLASTPPDEYYGALFHGLARINKSIDIKIKIAD